MDGCGSEHRRCDLIENRRASDSCLRPVFLTFDRYKKVYFFVTSPFRQEHENFHSFCQNPPCQLGNSMIKLPTNVEAGAFTKMYTFL